MVKLLRLITNIYRLAGALSLLEVSFTKSDTPTLSLRSVSNPSNHLTLELETGKLTVVSSSDIAVNYRYLLLNCDSDFITDLYERRIDEVGLEGGVPTSVGTCPSEATHYP